MVDLEELKDKASVATPGPWCHQVKDGAIFTTWGTQGGWIALTRKGDDCAYIAAANPSAVLELIERLQQAETERDALKTEIARLQEQNYSLACAVEDLAREREAARKQEPVAYRIFDGEGNFDYCDKPEPWQVEWAARFNRKHEPLYASPVQAQPRHVQMPTNADEAAAMHMVGLAWLEHNAPERLNEEVKGK